MEPARVRINDHRLMHDSASSPAEYRVSAQRETVRGRTYRKRRVLWERSALHAFVFIISFVFSVGVATLCILTFVRSSENLFGLVIAGLASAGAFVSLFVWIRTMILEHGKGRFTAPEEDEVEHHTIKGVAYGFVALVFAILLAGLIMNTASAGALPAV